MMYQYILKIKKMITIWVLSLLKRCLQTPRYSQGDLVTYSGSDVFEVQATHYTKDLEIIVIMRNRENKIFSDFEYMLDEYTGSVNI